MTYEKRRLQHCNELEQEVLSLGEFCEFEIGETIHVFKIIDQIKSKLKK